MQKDDVTIIEFIINIISKVIMKLKKTSPKIMVLSFDDRKRLTDFFVLLIKVDKRNAKNAKSTKNRKIKTKCYNPGPHIRGPCLLSVLHLFLTYVYSRHTKTNSMIDTIVLTLSNDMFRINNPDKFTPSARWALANDLRAVPGFRSKQNPTKKELKAGIYKPRLTLYPFVQPGNH